MYSRPYRLTHRDGYECEVNWSLRLYTGGGLNASPYVPFKVKNDMFGEGLDVSAIGVWCLWVISPSHSFKFTDTSYRGCLVRFKRRCAAYIRGMLRQRMRATPIGVCNQRE